MRTHRLKKALNLLRRNGILYWNVKIRYSSKSVICQKSLVPLFFDRLPRTMFLPKYAAKARAYDMRAASVMCPKRFAEKL